MTDVVVTGLGAVTAAGEDFDETWSAVKRGDSGAGPITLFDASEYPKIPNVAFEVDADPDEWELADSRRMGRFTQFAVRAAEEALTDADLDRSGDDRGSTTVGTSIGTAMGGALEFEEYAEQVAAGDRVSPRAIIRYLPNLAAGHVSIEFDAHGPNRTPTTACAAGAHAISDAASDIRTGRADVMLAGGAETFTPTILGTFGALRGLSTRDDEPEAACRPFDEDRDGTVVGEGAAVLVLESREHAEQRGATPLATLGGAGLSADASHPTKPPDDAAGMRKAVEAALADADVDPADVDHVNAHATGTPTGDVHESTGLNAVFDDCPPVTSTKSLVGHPYGASGAIEAAFTVNAVDEGVMPPTKNCENRDDDCPVPVVTEARDADVDVALSNSFGFGGTNGALVFEST
ncbi:beta-ketoacyl synthase [Halobacteriales archaeon QS_1_68_20]|nr:MAG: beta-ketoacyl synthase [Halobacteriales archaeon QS_1_68_20]